MGAEEVTREVAIKAIQDFIGWFKEDSLIRKALDMAIQALSQEPTDRIEYGTDGNAYKLWISNGKEFEQKPCDDAISRILQRMWNCRGKHTTSIDKVAMEQIIRDELPSVTQKSKTGHWIYNRHKQGVTCSECDAYRKYFGFFEFYCPNCGTRMSDKPCIEKEMPYVTEEEMQKCKEIVKKYTQNCGAKMFEPQESEDKE